MTIAGRTVKALAQPTKHAFLFVLNRDTGEPIWPIEERPVPQSDVPGERTSPTQPFPTRPAPFVRHGMTADDLLDLTPALKAEALEVAKRYRMGPIFTPPVLSTLDGPLGTLTVPSEVGGANWPGGSMDPENNFLYIHSHTTVVVNGLVPGNPAQTDMAYVGGRARAGRRRPRRGSRWRWRTCRRPRPRRRHGAGPSPGQTAVRQNHRVQHEHRRHRLAEDA
jgi:quinoprotein glucose dehydrogenase